MPSQPHKDSDLFFPNNTVVTASAGSGKTYALTWRYLQLLLSDKNQHKLLRNILAITFTNNAAKEMRERALSYLKQLCLGNEEVLRQAADFITDEGSILQRKACDLIDRIFDNYSDFQVKTIDSFMATVFKASSLEFGFHPDFDILMTNDTLVDEAFDLLARDLRSMNVQLYDRLAQLISENRSGKSRYLWDPFAVIVREVKSLYRVLSAQAKNELLEDVSEEVRTLVAQITKQADGLGKLIDESGLQVNRHLGNDLNLIRKGDIGTLMGHSLKATAVNKPKSQKEQEAFRRWGGEIDTQREALNELLRRYVFLSALSYYQPYLRAIAMVREPLARLKRQRGQLFIEDVNKMLASRLNEEAVPDVYFRLGDTIYHYLIDEFQDTSPIQWANLEPLIENSLSVGGSLYVVGDMKQSIYGFRGADWTIMKRMTERNEFPSARHEVKALGTNWRSCEKIIDVTTEVFENVVPGTEYADAARESGLNKVHQEVREENKAKGYVEITFLNDAAEGKDEMEHVLRVLEDCHARGYRYSDIAVITPTNNKVLEVSGWLNQRGIGFLSYSSLDARTRKAVGDVIALLKFLDSPIDNLSIATFLTGDLFGRVLEQEGGGLGGNEIRALMFEYPGKTVRSEPLYKTFQTKYPLLWDRYFERLYTQVGFLPLYDLVSEIYATFNVFGVYPEEEAAFAKLLDAVMSFEEEGTNSIKNFLERAEDENDQSSWEIDAPADMDAVSLMTIHKAKGLERPVVIVLLEDARPDRRTYFIQDEADGIRVLRITADMAAKVGTLQELYSRERLNGQVDELNRLYVALTRAKEELYVIATEGERDKPPVMFLPRSGYSPVAKPDVPARKPLTERARIVYHHAKPAIHKEAPYEPVGFEESRRGERIHEVLASIEFLRGSLDGVLDSALRALRAEVQRDISIESVKRTLIEFLEGSGVGEYFSPKPGRRVLTEQEFVTGDGLLFRADRVIVDDGRVTVIDFKTGGDEQEGEYVKQVRTYMGIVREVFSTKVVVGVIAYVDRKKLRLVE